MGLRLLAWTVIAALGALVVVAPISAVAQGSVDEEAVKRVVQAFNDAASAATAARDVTLVQPYVTDGYFAELSPDLQGDWLQGVQTETLVSIDWGSISVTGDTATVRTLESWNVQLDDGTGGVMDDNLNVYRLVRESDGTWKIDANDHPGS